MDVLGMLYPDMLYELAVVANEQLQGGSRRVRRPPVLSKNEIPRNQSHVTKVADMPIRALSNFFTSFICVQIQLQALQITQRGCPEAAPGQIGSCKAEAAKIPVVYTPRLAGTFHYRQSPLYRPVSPQRRCWGVLRSPQ